MNQNKLTHFERVLEGNNLRIKNVNFTQGFNKKL